MSGKARRKFRQGESPSGSVQASSSPSPADMARAYETVALVLQGGGALGSYQCGVYEGLHQAGIRPDWFAGTSIGAINAAILAGNAPELRVQRLREFWQRISLPALPLPETVFNWQQHWLNALPQTPAMQRWINSISAAGALLHGQRDFFSPRLLPFFTTTAKNVAATASFYDTKPLKQTLEHFVDFDRINAEAQRFSVGAVNVRTGNFVYFDNRDCRIRPEHILASAALPPAFPAIEIDGEFYWDGGLVSNTPLEYVQESQPRRDVLVLQVDLWSARGALPSSLMDVLERQKDIHYSSRTRHGTDNAAERQRLRLALNELTKQLPNQRFPDELQTALEPWTCTKVLNIVHLIYQAKAYEEEYKDYAFGISTMHEHWNAGLADMQRTLARPQYFALPPREVGVVTHDIHRRDSHRP